MQNIPELFVQYSNSAFWLVIRPDNFNAKTSRSALDFAIKQTLNVYLTVILRYPAQLKQNLRLFCPRVECEIKKSSTKRNFIKSLS